jgi:hypothetical protein
MIRKNHYLIAIFLLSVLVFYFGTGNTIAADNDGDEVDDDFEDLNKRTVEVSNDAEKYTIKSVEEKGETKNSIEIEFEPTGEGLYISTEYQSDNESVEIELEFQILFVSIIEYNDTNEDGMYNDTVDDVKVQEVPLNSFRPVENKTSEISEGCTLHHYVINTTDDVFSVHIYVVEEFAVVNSSLITPYEAKIDIIINNFNYKNSSSRLALYTRLESELDYDMEDDMEDEKYGYSTGEEGVTTTMNGTTGFFSWAKTAKIDGLTKNVLSSNKTIDHIDIDSEKVYFNYVNGTHIFHDPRIGVEGLIKTASKSSSSSSSSSKKDKKEAIPGYAISIFLGMATLATIGLIYTKQKKLKDI